MCVSNNLGSDLTEADEPVNGRTCIFIRERLETALEEYRTTFLQATATVALHLQSCFRMRNVRIAFKVMKKGSTLLQSQLRCKSQRKRFAAQKAVTNKIKALFRMCQLRRRYVVMREAINYLKSKFTGAMIQRIRYKRLQRARKCLQGLARGFMARNAALITYRAMLTLQRTAKAFVTRRRWSRLLLASTLKVQHRFRGYLTRVKFAHIVRTLSLRRKQRVANRVVRHIQALWRGKLVTKRFMEIFCATVRLQAWVRARSERKRFAKLVKLVIWLQCTARRVVAHNKAHAVVVTRMVESELGLLADLFKREMHSIRMIPNHERVLGSGYLRNGVSRFERFLISFDVNFDLSFAYPNGWLATLMEFSRKIREEEKKVIMKVITGSHHTVILDDCDNIYTWGLGDIGQLGHNSRVSFPKPQKIEKLNQYLASAAATSTSIPSFSPGMAVIGNPSGGRISQNIGVKDICCGKDHTLLLTGACVALHCIMYTYLCPVLIFSYLLGLFLSRALSFFISYFLYLFRYFIWLLGSGVVYSWGDNRRGQLGHSK